MITETKTTTPASRAAILRNLADCGRPLPREISFGDTTLTLTFDTCDDLQVWSDYLGAEVMTDRRQGSNGLIHTWHVGRWSGWRVSLHMFEHAADVETVAGLEQVAAGSEVPA